MNKGEFAREKVKKMNKETNSFETNSSITNRIIR